MREPKHGQLGQSTIEFIVTFTFGLGIVFLFVSLALNYSAGFLVHYATFMASRTYLTVESHTQTEGTTANMAKEEALKTLNRFRLSSLGVPTGSVLNGGGSAPGFYINAHFPVVTPRSDILYVGAYTVFEREPSLFKLIAGGDKVRYVSESYLGKEPSRIECWKQTCNAILLGLGSTSECDTLSTNDFTVFDNGC